MVPLVQNLSLKSHTKAYFLPHKYECSPGFQSNGHSPSSAFQLYLISIVSLNTSCCPWMLKSRSLVWSLSSPHLVICYAFKLKLCMYTPNNNFEYPLTLAFSWASKSIPITTFIPPSMPHFTIVIHKVTFLKSLITQCPCFLKYYSKIYSSFYLV